MRCRHCQTRSRDIHRLRTACEAVVAGQTAIRAVAQGKRSDRHRFGGADVFAGDRSSAAQDQCFCTNECPHHQYACSHIRCAVIAARAAQVDRKRVDRADCVVGVSNVVVARHIRAATVENHQATGGDCLVAAADIFAAKDLRRRCADDFASTRACQCADSGCASCSRASVIGLGDLRGGYREVCSGDIGA